MNMDRQFTKNGFFKAIVAKINGEAVDEMWTDETLVQFATEEIEKLAAANAKAAEKRAERSAENDALKTNILARLTEPKTASVIAEELEISTQKASAMLRQLREAGTVIAEEIKVGKSRALQYSIPKKND
jgi:DNA-binding Lrp family transcriptional regulator